MSIRPDIKKVPEKCSDTISTAGLVETQFGTAYETVKKIADTLPSLMELYNAYDLGKIDFLIQFINSGIMPVMAGPLTTDGTSVRYPAPDLGGIATDESYFVYLDGERAYPDTYNITSDINGDYWVEFTTPPAAGQNYFTMAYRPHVTSGGVGAPTASVVLAYRREPEGTTPVVPSGDATYNFTTGELNNSDGWTVTPPPKDPNNPVMWMISAPAYDPFGNPATITNDKWTTPVIYSTDAKDGTAGTSGIDGVNRFRELVFKRSNSVPAVPTGGTYDNPHPAGWSDSIPAGTEDLWMSSKEWFSDGTTDNDPWSDPALIFTSSGFETQFSSHDLLSYPGTPDAPENGAVWTDTPADTDSKWMATRTLTNGTAGNWVITQIAGDNEESYFKSTVFIRGNQPPARPVGGTWSQPVPNGWSDGIPAGTLQIWMSTRKFSSLNTYNDPQWSDPQPISDTETVDFEFCDIAADPGDPTVPANGAVWSNTAGPDTVWMAMRTLKNGEYGPWKVWRVKGEKGDVGLTGDVGTEGATFFTWIAYADDDQGNGISYLPDGKAYMGIEYLALDPFVDISDPSIFKWSKVLGDKGDTGVEGESVLVAYAFQRNDTQPATPTGGTYASPTPAFWSDGPTAGVKQLWMVKRTFTKSGSAPQEATWSTPVALTDTETLDFEYSDYTGNDPGTPTAPLNGATWTNTASSASIWMAQRTILNGNPQPWEVIRVKGEQGVAYYTWIKYSANADGTGMVDVPDATTDYIGIRTWQLDAGESNDPTDYTWSKYRGDIGPQGVPGPQGDATYTWIKYADDAAGTGLSNDPAGKTHIGLAYNKLTATESVNPGDYTWTKIVGEQGTQGIAGPAGADGQTTYTWLVYSAVADGGNPDGSDLQQVPDATTEYIGLAVNKTTATESTDPADYVWSKFKGDQGLQGIPGPQGPALYTWVKYADDDSGTNMSDDPAGKGYVGFAYNKTDPNESTNPADYAWSQVTGVAGIPGADGQTFYTWLKFSAVSGGGAGDGSDMTDTAQADTEYMGIATNKPSPTESTNPSDYIWQKTKGDQGIQGPAGATTYTWVRYADAVDGTGISNDPTGKTYIGFAYNKLSATESTDPADYTWALLKGQDGPQGPQGVPGPTGPDGTTYYTWLKYSDNSDGSGLYDTPTASTEYLGIAVGKLSATESNDPADYTWAKFKGEQGIQGPAAPTQYTWIRYADTETGTGISNNPTGKAYIGFAYNKSTSTESNTPTDYTWSKIKGEQGNQGVQGPQGADGNPTYTWIKYSDNADGSGMYDVPTATTAYIGIATNKLTQSEAGSVNTDYIWSKFRGDQGVQGIPGTSSYVHIAYANSADGTTDFTTADSAPAQAEYSYVGMYIDYAPAGDPPPADSTDPLDYTWNRVEGTQGIQGPAGNTYYLHMAYANANDGTDFIVDPADPSQYTWVGTAITVNDPVAPSVYTAYKWMRFQGFAGDRNAQGVVYWNVPRTTAPGQPSATSYDFDTGTFGGLTTNWQVNPPTYTVENGKAIWYSYFNVLENTRTGAQAITFSSAQEGTKFTGLVVFTATDTITDDQGNSLSFGPSGTTTIDGGNITTGTVNADRLNIGDIIASGSIEITSGAQAKADAAQAAAEATAATDATNKANAAQSTAISTASSDAQAKADAAEVAAIHEAEALAKALESRGEQLVINGSGILGDNTNFSTFTFKGDVAPPGMAGSFYIKSGSTTKFVDEIFPVDPTQKYIQSAYLRSVVEQSRAYMFTQFYDADKLSIGSLNHMYLPGTTTTLAQDLKDGDTVVHLSAATFNTTVSQTYQRTLMFWDYTNSKGFTYPPETYTRHRSANNTWTSGSAINGTQITLASPWTGGTVPAGTSVSQGSLGGSYKYVGAINVLLDDTWQKYTGTIEGVDYSGNNVGGKFPPGVAYASVGFLLNRESSLGSNSESWVSGVSFQLEYETVEGAQAKSDAAQAAAEAHATALDIANRTYTDGEVTSAQTAAVNSAKAYADAQDVVYETTVKAYADGQADSAEQAAIAQAQILATAAEDAAVAHANALDVAARAYTDGEVSTAEAAAIASAKAYADAQDIVYETTVKAYADGKATAAENAAIAAAEAYADARKIEAEAYADGIVTQAEQDAINTANAYADTKKTEAIAAAAADATTKAELAELRAKTNLIDLTGWRIGNSRSNVAGLSDYSSDAVTTNEIIRVAGPNGGIFNALRYTTTVSQHPSGAWSGGFRASVPSQVFNPESSYLFTCWVRRPNIVVNGYFYAGYDSTNMVNLSTGSVVGNPYSISSVPISTITDWALVVIVVHGANYTGSDSGVCGIYSPITGEKLHDGIEYKLKPGATGLYVRIASYRTDVGDEVEYAQPRWQELNGTEVSYAEILGITESTANSVAISTAATDATTKANNAQANAISTAASDATTKANNAETNAKNYSDTQFTANRPGILTEAANTARTQDKDAGSVAGWTLSPTLIYSGNPAEDDEYSSSGITLGSTGYLSSPNFKITTGGFVDMRGDLTVEHTNGEFSGVRSGNTYSFFSGATSTDIVTDAEFLVEQDGTVIARRLKLYTEAGDLYFDSADGFTSAALENLGLSSQSVSFTHTTDESSSTTKTNTHKNVSTFKLSGSTNNIDFTVGFSVLNKTASGSSAGNATANYQFVFEPPPDQHLSAVFGTTSISVDAGGTLTINNTGGLGISIYNVSTALFSNAGDTGISAGGSHVLNVKPGIDAVGTFTVTGGQGRDLIVTVTAKPAVTALDEHFDASLALHLERWTGSAWTAIAGSPKTFNRGTDYLVTQTGNTAAISSSGGSVVGGTLSHDFTTDTTNWTAGDHYIRTRLVPTLGSAGTQGSTATFKESANSGSAVARSVRAEDLTGLGFAADLVTGNKNFTGSVTIAGDLTVNGTNTILNTTTLDVDDNIITVNKGQTSTPALDGGIEVERGTSTNSKLIWNEGNDQWEIDPGTGTSYKVWHSGNDGPGSGLNADTLDGISSGSFLRSDAVDTATGRYTITNNSASDGTQVLSLISSSAYLLRLRRTGSTNNVTIRFEDASHGRYFGLSKSGNLCEGPTADLNGSGFRLFSDNYHPNADKWTTARTLTLTGDVTGSVSMDGSGNVSLTTTVGDDSHRHKTIADYSNSLRRVLFPGGATYATQTSVVTGAIEVELPVSWTSDMISFTVVVFDYAAHEAFEVKCSGYNYASGDGAWINTSAQVIGSRNDSNTTVRFGHNGTKCCVWVGNTDSTWSYPQVHVRDFMGGYGSPSAAWETGWAINFVTTQPNIDATFTGLRLASGTADKWTTARTLTLTGDVTGSVAMDGSGNVSLSTTVGNDSHTHDTRYGTLSASSNIWASDQYFNATTFWRVSASDTASQRADARNDATNFSRLHWYGVSDTGGTSNFRHAWYDGASYINVTCSSGVVSWSGGASFASTVTAPTFSGNATSASKWNTARTLTLTGDVTGSASIDGSGNVSLTTAVGNDSHTHDGRYYTESESDTRFPQINRSRNNTTFNANTVIGSTGFWKPGSNATNLPASTYGTLLNFNNSDTNQQLYLGHGTNSAGELWFRSDSASSMDAPWKKLLDSSNFNSYAPTLTGTGASGTWGISISGNAATATKSTATHEADYGIHGGYGNSNGTGTDWGANIWSMGTSYDGGHAGAGYTMGGYCIAWLRSGCSEYNANIGEGMYVESQNVLRGGIGTAGIWHTTKMTAPTFVGALSGNATTATTATNCSRTITAGTGLSGGGALSSNVSLSVASTYSPNTALELVGGLNLNDIQTPGFYYQTANADAASGSNYPADVAGSLLVQDSAASGSAGATQMYIKYSDGTVYTRGGYGSWSGWKTQIDSLNYNTWVPTKTGGGASGTWGISITGNAATSTTATKWASARTLTLTGDVTGSVAIDGSGNVSLSTTVGNDNHTHDGRYYTESESDSRFSHRFRGTTTAVANAWVKVASVEGTGLGCIFDFSAVGTTGGVVVSAYGRVIVNHSQDVQIELANGNYTRLDVRVVSDSNDGMDLWFKTASSNAATLNIEVSPLNNETVWLDSTTRFSGTTFDVTGKVGGIVLQAAGGTASSYTASTFYGALSGNAATATWADTVDVNSGNTSSTWYDVCWHSGDTLYSSTGVEIQGSTQSLRASRLQITQNAGYFYGDANYTRFTGSSFYIDAGVPNCYIYATNTYLGSTSGDTIRLRGNTMNGDGGFSLLNGAMTVASLSATGNITAAGDVGYTSDIRVKSEIEPISSPRERVEKLTGCTYYRTDLQYWQHGHIAQDVKEALEHGTIEGEKDFGENELGKLSINAAAVPALHTENIKELYRENDELKARVAKLEAALEKLING